VEVTEVVLSLSSPCGRIEKRTR
jgi:transposase